MGLGLWLCLSVLDAILMYNDINNFIKKNFELAVEKFKPEAVVFLGDVMDEGSIAGEEEFSRYLSRLKSIFLENDKLQYIWIPGDNDIGGEGFEKVSASKLLQFHDTFGHENPVPLNGINFIKVNRLIHEKPQGKWTEKLSNRTNVVISHMPLLLAPGIYSKTIINQLNPSVIFSAHEHKSFSIKMNKFLSGQKTVTHITKADKKVKRYRIGGDVIHEFIVPTCSYRMGVEESGFGAAVINGYGSYLDYTVLWLPSRLQTLRNYLYFTCILIISILLNASCLCFRRLRRFKLKSRSLSN
ncbi:uncharacterized protein LOC113376458 isoform X2 [Ctenocephalides felis]|uniref:uncharacterized protein LOC113376458 isoform X2 n=1 Tax=Ctenocephalides felis TaxID=7515 RepID=UPI000E6E4DA3|nr:uncharacterized protein LOC113376458 isoform X2 [Ctenocephalides felis]